MEIETEAIVLRRFDFSETSQIGHLFTEHHGRLSCLAKGIKRPNALLKGPMDLFQRAKVRLQRRAGSDLALMTRYEPVSGYRGLRRGLEPLFAAFYVVDLFHAATPEHDVDVVLYGLLRDTLACLSRAGERSIPGVLIACELSFLARTGFGLHLSRCARCREPVHEARQPLTVFPCDGGHLCVNCRQGATAAVSLGAGAAALVRGLSEVGLAGAANLKGSQAQVQEVRRLLDCCVSALVDKRLPSAMFLNPAAFGAAARRASVDATRGKP